MIPRLEKLFIEKEIASNLSLLPAQTKQIIDMYYRREIHGIEEYGKENPDEKIDSLVKIKRLINIKGIKEKRKNGDKEIK